jgi:hypothetical protein
VQFLSQWVPEYRLKQWTGVVQLLLLGLFGPMDCKCFLCKLHLWKNPCYLLNFVRSYVRILKIQLLSEGVWGVLKATMTNRPCTPKAVWVSSVWSVASSAGSHGEGSGAGMSGPVGLALILRSQPFNSVYVFLPLRWLMYFYLRMHTEFLNLLTNVKRRKIEGMNQFEL